MLNKFKNNLDVNLPLKHLFVLSGYKTPRDIKSKIEEISGDSGLRRGLQSKLTNEATKHFANIWKHKIEIDIEITEGLMCNVNIKDKGILNKHKFFNMDARSHGFRQFMALMKRKLRCDFIS